VHFVQSDYRLPVPNFPLCVFRCFAFVLSMKPDDVREDILSQCLLAAVIGWRRITELPVNVVIGGVECYR